jgi:acyl-CoA thioesterase-1
MVRQVTVEFQDTDRWDWVRLAGAHLPHGVDQPFGRERRRFAHVMLKQRKLLAHQVVPSIFPIYGIFRTMRLLTAIVAAAFFAACGTNEPHSSSVAQPEQTRPPEQAAAADNRPLIVAFGDSLSAGYGVDPGQSYPDHLQRALDEANLNYRVVNAGISGDTTSAGLSRLNTITALKPNVVILELGGNDGLRGLPIEATRANLEEMIVALKPAGATVVLAGMTLPPNYGPEYISRFEQVYVGLAAKHQLALIPFLLDGIAGNPSLMQNDGIHPTAEGNRLAAANVMKVLAAILAG